MAKEKTVFVCSNCGRQEGKWLGRCPECGEWNSFSQTAVRKEGARGSGRSQAAKGSSRAVPEPVALNKVTKLDNIRFSTGISEMDNVLGGGVMKGAAVLVGGEPGIGKSTILLQLAALTDTAKTLYVSGEESAEQVRMRAERLNLPLKRITVLCETRLPRLLEILQKKTFDLVIIDSIQTVYSEDAGDIPGTVNQIKYASLELVDSAKLAGTALFLVGHVTKEGGIAGPKAIEHLVDTVLYFDQGDHGIRLLRSSKNRFGSVDEIGVFTMTEKGLIPALEPQSFFLSKRNGQTPPGVAAAAVFEGSRTFMVEIQVLAVPAKAGYSKISSDRIDTARVSRIAAVLEKHIGLQLSNYDLYVNVAGGIRLTEVGIELPLALALISARTNTALRGRLAAAGELSLAGEVRSIGHLEKRVSAAQQMGFLEFLGPIPHGGSTIAEQLRQMYVACGDISEAVLRLRTAPTSQAT